MLRNHISGLGVTVLDFTQIGAGPTCTMLLADMGADVIKVEAPAASSAARSARRWTGRRAALFHGFNRNKLGVALDLKQPDGVGRGAHADRRRRRRASRACAPA